MSEISLLINGQKKAASNGATFQRHNPLDGKVATTAPAATTEDAVAAVEAASKAFPEWAAMGPTARRELLRSEEHTSELQSRGHLVCRLLLEKKKSDSGEYGAW